MHTLKELVKGTLASFEYYRQGVMYYRIRVNKALSETEKDKPDPAPPWEVYVYEFPIPLDDIGNATLLRKNKAITLMPWVRKALEDKTIVLVKQEIQW